MKTEQRKAWHKQCAAKMKRADTEGQLKMAQAMKGLIDESEILTSLERTFFLNRKQSKAILGESNG